MSETTEWSALRSSLSDLVGAFFVAARFLAGAFFAAVFFRAAAFLAVGVGVWITLVSVAMTRGGGGSGLGSVFPVPEILRTGHRPTPPTASAG